LRRSSPPHPDHAAHAPSAWRALKIRVVKLALWLHIYVSMFGLAAVLFFSVTGITLNHPDWFFGGAERREEAEGQVDVKWLHVGEPASAEGGGSESSGEPDRSKEVAKLEIVEHLRKMHSLRGALDYFRVEEKMCTVSFKGPAYAADADIDRESGHYNLTQTSHGLVAVLNALHQGRDTGPVWSVVIDVSAVVLTVISLTGLVLIFFLKLRRGPGLIVGLVGAGVIVAVCLLWVP
jgi:hypothetical protein